MRCFSLQILLLFRLQILALHQTSTTYAAAAEQLNVTSHCEASACGDILSIKYPFRLRDDPPQCGHPDYELVCENQTASLYLGGSSTYYHDDREKYHYGVKSINYDNKTIHIYDPSIISNDTCSFPLHSLPSGVFSPYTVSHPHKTLAWGITFFSCRYPLLDSSNYIENSCVGHQQMNDTSIIGISSRSGWHKYIKIGDMYIAELGNNCMVELVSVIPAREDRHNNNSDKLSLSEIHTSLLDGFELSWHDADCEGCLTHPSFYCQLCAQAYRRDLHWFEYIPAYCLAITCFLLNGSENGILLQHGRIIEWAVFVILYIIEFITLAKLFIGVPILLGLLIQKLRRRHLSTFDVIEGFLQNHSLAPIRYSYSDIKKMTGGFRKKLGQGGYGSVYQGKLRSGPDVAVKVLSTKSKSDGQDFMNEVATIGRVHHVNVVKLVGYCAERNKRALLYEFMPNGSLDKYILKQETTEVLTWEKKYEIAVGVARGIEYLHRGCDVQILHFDIKPHNILLDERFTPKISDFGLAKFYSTEKNTVALTAARGTIGYVAPELINRSIGNVSYKADVYSFGMMLMEMVGLKRDLVHTGDESSQYFPYWIYNHLDKWKDIEEGINDIEEKITRKMAIVALWCIQMSPGDRPSMSRVVEMLESEDESLEVPPKPAESPQVVTQDWDTGSTWDTEYTDDSATLLSNHHSTNSIYRSN